MSQKQKVIIATASICLPMSLTRAELVYGRLAGNGRGEQVLNLGYEVGRA